MEIVVFGRSFSTGGADPTLYLAGQYLTSKLSGHSSAFDGIELTANFRSRKLPTGQWRDACQAFDESLINLPRMTFNRSKRRIELEYESRLLEWSEAFKSNWRPRYSPNAAMLGHALQELKAQLEFIQSRLDDKINFDFASFLVDVQSAIDSAPTSDAAVLILQATFETAARNRAAALDPWQRLGIDWDEYHRSARKLLNDPFLWEQSNDLAPNGNDTGADVLIEYQDWRPQHKRRNPTEFLLALLQGWDVNLELAPDRHAVDDAATLIKRDEFSFSTFDDAAIGLVFACLKVDGKLAADVAALALKAIERQSLDVVIEHRGWHDAAERKQSLSTLAQVLRPYATR